MYVAVGFLFVVLFCKALEIIVVRATGLIAGNKTNAINQLRIEFDALKMEIKGLKTELEVTAHSTKWQNTRALYRPHQQLIRCCRMPRGRATSEVGLYRRTMVAR